MPIWSTPGIRMTLMLKLDGPHVTTEANMPVGVEVPAANMAPEQRLAFRPQT
jgi:hypothetical protein